MIKNNLKKIVPATYSKIDSISKIVTEQILDSQIRLMSKIELDYEVQLVEHCNLNCARCSHFCPVADPEFLDIKEYENDVKRLSELFEGEANFIRLMGGEPLLHPKINEFMEVTRKYFKNAIIDLDTNGVALLNMKKSFFEAVRNNNINISVTKYPIGLDYDKMQKKCNDEKVSFRFFDDQIVRKFNLLPLDLEGRGCTEKNFLKCYLANSCHTLKHGKMYTCSTIPHISHFNKYFGCNLRVTKKDYIDIYKVNSGKEILEFFSKPVPFCKYCNVECRKYNYDWCKSSKEITEWVCKK